MGGTSRIIKFSSILTRERSVQVSEILSLNSPRDSAAWQSDDDIADVTYKPSPFRGSVSSSNLSPSPKGIVLRHRREVGDLLRQKEKQSRRQNVNSTNNVLLTVQDPDRGANSQFDREYRHDDVINARHRIATRDGGITKSVSSVETNAGSYIFSIAFCYATNVCGQDRPKSPRPVFGVAVSDRQAFRGKGPKLSRHIA